MSEEVVVKSLFADEQDVKRTEAGAPLIEAFNALSDRQKIGVLEIYIARCGSLPVPPKPETPPAPSPSPVSPA